MRAIVALVRFCIVADDCCRTGATTFSSYGAPRRDDGNETLIHIAARLVTKQRYGERIICRVTDDTKTCVMKYETVSASQVAHS